MDSRKNDFVYIPRAEYEAMKKALETNQATINQLKAQLQFLSEQQNLSRKARFGRSSEQTKYEDGSEQLSFFTFNEIEKEAAKPQVKEPELTEVKAHKRRKSLTAEGRLPSNIEEEVHDYELPEEERVCPSCGSLMIDIGIGETTKNIKIIPATVVIETSRLHSYGCPCCSKNGISTPIVTAKRPAAIIPHSIATPEAVAYVAQQKFTMASPLHRLEQEFNANGIELTKQTMSNWLINVAERYLAPLQKCMRAELFKNDIVHADETPVQVLHEKGRPASAESRMWVYRTGRSASQQIILYDYTPTRKREHALEFIDPGWNGYLITDAYAGYKEIRPGITNVFCMAHARRKFNDAMIAIKNKESETYSMAKKGKSYFDALFQIETQMDSKNLTSEERLTFRKENAEPILQEFHEWLYKISPLATPKGKLGEAIGYCLNNWKYLCNYLLDERIEPSNNRAERSIKPFVIGRKNWLFANTPRGADASAIYYSIVETAKANNLNPYRYMVWLLKTALTLDMEDENAVARLLPANAPEECAFGCNC